MISAKEFLSNIYLDKICHYTLIDGLNDTDKEIYHAISFCKDINAQLRILEFNEPNVNTGFFPSKRKDEVIKILKNSGVDFKLCYSSGKSIKAACGMFK